MHPRIIVVYATALVGTVCLGCGKTSAVSETIRPVRAVKVGDLKAIQGREFPGRAKARDEVDLSFRVAGPLIALAVDVGSKVKKGDVIARIDPKDFQTALESAMGNLSRAQANLLAMQRGARPEEIEQLKAAVAEAEANYRQALAEHDRNAGLIRKAVISQSEFDVSLARRDRTAAQLKRAREELIIGQKGARPEDVEAKRAEIKSLEAAVANAKNQLEDSVLKAPFSGNVASRYVDNFQTVQAKQPIIKLLDDSTIEVTVQVPENLISLVPRVKEAVCRFDAFAGREFIGKVTKSGSEASQTTRTYPVTVEVSQPEDVRILPGMAATVRAKSDSSSGGSEDLIVPSSAVFSGESGPQSYVWVIREGDNKVTRRAVKTGKTTSAGLVVNEGLKAGEWVVTAGVNTLREDQVVKILESGGR
jgi:multidrug efflux pump subunit AcrA (membrane-fusion protein)